jgi:dipeptidase D
VTDGDWLTADGTTLGADNGIAIAIALAIAQDDTIEHPPLELLFTVDEESGLTGAHRLSPDWLRSTTLINLDSEDEGVLTVGCAGGLNSMVSVPVTHTDAPSGLSWVKLVVSGLQGGHSGADIHLDRANANVLVARVAADLYQRLDAAIGEIHGGNASNAIPRDSHVVLGITRSRLADAQAAVAQWQAILAAEYTGTDPELTLALTEIDAPKRVLDAESTKKAINTLRALPHGVIRMSRTITGLVETSTNLATVRTSAGKLEIGTSQRSSSEPQLEAIAGRISSVAGLAGGSVVANSRYPAWEPQTTTELLSKAKTAYHSLFNREPLIEVVHAGLECGVIGAKYPGMEMLSIGPTIEMAHSPDERLHLPSIDLVWRFLTQLLKSLK